MKIRGFVLACSLLTASTGWSDSRKIESEDAATHQISAQGSYGGGIPGSWEWELGSKRSGENLTGISAHGLLAVHNLTGLREHEDAALVAAKSLLRAFDRGWSKRRPYTQDIEFLAAAGYIVDAGRWFKVTTRRYAPHAYAEMVATGRRQQPQLLGWDLASAIRAALAVGQVRYARALLGQAIQRRRSWDRPGPAQALARGSMLWALGALQRRGGLDAEQRQLAGQLLRDLLHEQHASGAWRATPGGDALSTQATAYAVMGLAQWARGKAGAARGRAWLMRVALTDRTFYVGGRFWAAHYTPAGKPDRRFISAVQSEAMMALASN